MNKTQQTTARRVRRHARIRSKVSGTSARPRLCIFKSTNAVYAQIIDDENGVTIVATDSRKVKGDKPLTRAKEAGIEIAKKANEKKITEVVFDRGGYEYKGKIQAIAEGAREGGLKF